MIASDRRARRARRVPIRSSLLAVALLALPLTTATRVALAGDAAGAEVLFSEGKRLVQEGNYAAACPKFEESQKLDPGMGTLFRLADCYEHVGRTASAWAAFLEVAASAKTAGQQARAEDAKRRAGDLEPHLSRLSIHVATPDLTGLVVKRGEVAVGRAQWNTPMPVDPGEIAVEATAPGRTAWHGKILVAKSASTKIDVPELALGPIEGESLTAGGAGHGTASHSSWGPQRTAAVIAGGLGVVGLGLGAIFGLSSMSNGSDADGHCDADNFCDDEGLALRRDARSAGDLSTIGFVAGGVLATAGVVLWFTAPAERSSASGTSAARAPRAGIVPTFAGASFAMELP